MKSFTFLFSIAALALLIAGHPALAQVLNSCDQWANYCDGSYCVYNNLWGDNAGPQCINAQSTTQWTVRSTQSGTGVKTYPNSSREPLGVSIGSLISLSSSMSVSGPGTGDYCTAWDIWCPEEVMIWINKYGDVAPWGSFVETANIGGVTWDVYKNGYPGFVRQSNTNSMTVDIKAILDYCVSKGWLSNSGKIEKVQGGFEITSTGGTERTFTMNSYSVSIQSTEEIEKPPERPPASETPTTGVWYKILAGHTGKALTVENRATNAGANVVQWDYEGSHQEWSLEDAGDSGAGYLKIINRNSGMCLEVQDWNTSDGGNVRQGQFADYQNNQMWTLEKEGNYYQIINRNSGKLVDVEANSNSNGANVHQWSYFGADAYNQKWSFQSVGSAGTTAPTTAPTNAPTNPPTNPPSGTLGDVNSDGSINIVDALLVAQYYVGLNPQGFDIARADTNCDGSVNIVDALLIAQYYVGLINRFC
jgi:hypothetical protein